MAVHFAEHRSFYRAMFTGTCAYSFNAALAGLFAVHNRRLVQEHYGRELDETVAQDMTDFLTAGVSTLVHTWVVEAPDPLDPAELTGRLERIVPLVFGANQIGPPPRPHGAGSPQTPSTSQP
jgi:hypothetical protein